MNRICHILYLVRYYLNNNYKTKVLYMMMFYQLFLSSNSLLISILSIIRTIIRSIRYRL
nr:MAG TPA: hypothetical protein [Caudoviricetes sp.]